MWISETAREAGVNAQTLRYYERRGFSFTGHTQPYPLDRSTLELEMAAEL